MTILLGPCPCASCGETVYVVRRTIVFLCSAHGPLRRLCTSPSIAPTVVDDDGSTHLCSERNARSIASGYTDTVGISDAPSRILLNALPSADTSREGVPRPEVSAL